MHSVFRFLRFSTEWPEPASENCFRRQYISNPLESHSECRIADNEVLIVVHPACWRKLQSIYEFQQLVTNEFMQTLSSGCINAELNSHPCLYHSVSDLCQPVNISGLYLYILCTVYIRLLFAIALVKHVNHCECPEGLEKPHCCCP